MSIIRKNKFLFSFSSYSMKFARIFDFSLRLLLVFLPFSTLLSVFFGEKLGIPWVSFLKEWLIFLMLLTLLLEHVRGRLRIIWSRYDLIIGIYIALFVGISLFTTGLSGIIYWGRYDFAFLILFFAVFHGYALLGERLSYYLRLFLIAWGVALFCSMLLKWPFSEDILLYFGYSGNPSNWQFGSAIPIFHGVEGANVRRFQWIFDGPNTMGAYLLVYMGIFTYYLRQKKDWYFTIGAILILFFVCIIYTYSRSALLGLLGWLFFILVFSARTLYRHYPGQVIGLSIIGILLVGGVFLQYGGNLQAIIERGGSSKWHAERMMIGVNKAISHPLWLWLWSEWPAYRYVENLGKKDRTEIEKLDVKNIPESWYIQQLVEGGMLGGIVFLVLMGVFFWNLYRSHVILAGMFLSILIMNFFLHTFESSTVSLSLFAVIGLILASYSSPEKHG